MENLKTMEGKIKAILKKNEETRGDDMLLYLKVCNAYLKDAGAMPLAEVMTQYKYLGLPSFESVCRIRRKLQAKHPELGGEQPCAPCPCQRRKRLSQLCERIVRSAYE